MFYKVTDWDDAYANGAHIPDAAQYPPRWQEQAAAFRSAHPPRQLDRSDLFLPDGDVAGLAVFIHGGYWMKFDPSFWSHFAAGPLAAGWAVLFPAYTLAPKARITEMTVEIAANIVRAAEIVDGPIALTGHSAGGQLAARMICNDGTLPDEIAARVSSCVPISALTDLRPLMRTGMNDTLNIDTGEAQRESPALLCPRMDIPVTPWVGGAERPEFIRQSRILADIWAGLGAETELVIDPGRHHFDVIEAMRDRNSPLVRRLLRPARGRLT